MSLTAGETFCYATWIWFALSVIGGFILFTGAAEFNSHSAIGKQLKTIYIAGGIGVIFQGATMLALGYAVRQIFDAVKAGKK